MYRVLLCEYRKSGISTGETKAKNLSAHNVLERYVT